MLGRLVVVVVVVVVADWIGWSRGEEERRALGAQRECIEDSELDDGCNDDDGCSDTSCGSW